jgi:SAM-dependent methyltransferase
MLGYPPCVQTRHIRSAEQARSSIASGQHEPERFRAAFGAVPGADRDAWVDLVLGLDELYDDGPDLPPGGVPYLPCPVDVLLRTIEEAGVGPSDTVVDLGSGPGRAVAFLHLMTGAGAIGIEIQPHLVHAGRDLASRLRLSRVSSIQGDAAVLAGFMMLGSVFFLYCPFSGARLQAVLDALEPIALTRELRICCVDLPPLKRPWLIRQPAVGEDLVIYRSADPRERMRRADPHPPRGKRAVNLA